MSVGGGVGVAPLRVILPNNKSFRFQGNNKKLERWSEAEKSQATRSKGRVGKGRGVSLKLRACPI